MGRQPQQVHIYPYRTTPEGKKEYAVFQRSDDPACRQGVCGGIENNETLEDGARREVLEEAGITAPLPLYRSDSLSFLPANIFHTRRQRARGGDVVVVPMYFFAMPFDGTIKLSKKHLACRWLDFESAHSLVYYADQKIALWELNERRRRGNLER